MTTDGTDFWVTDDVLDQVFVYGSAGTLQGRWGLDPANRAPTGITVNPVGGSDLWIVDRMDSHVYHYANGTTFRAGSHSADDTTLLALADSRPEGIADPPAITVQSPATGSQVQPGQTVLISGNVQASAPPVTSVTVNGTQAAAVDAAGNFFDTVTVAPGVNTLNLAASDASGQTTSTLTIHGDQPAAGKIDFSQLSDVTDSMVAEYGRTSLNSATDVLYADLSLSNTGTYATTAPLLVEIRHISHATVNVLKPDGLTADGTPYYDFSKQVSGNRFVPGATSGARTLAFYDPDGVRFTYDLVVLGHLDESPAFTSVPRVQTPAGKPYAYAATASDPENDTLQFILLAGPAGHDGECRHWPGDLGADGQPSRQLFGGLASR